MTDEEEVIETEEETQEEKEEREAEQQEEIISYSPTYSGEKTCNGTLTCFIWDIDETLAHTYLTFAQYKKVKDSKMGDLKNRLFTFALPDGYRYWGIRRRYWDVAVEWSFNNFDVVGIWTAGLRAYATKMTPLLLPPGRKKFDFVFAREQCVPVGKPPNEVWTKPLSKLCQVFPQIDGNNTLIADNSPDAIQFNPANLIHVSDYAPRSSLLGEYDSTLINVIRTVRDMLAKRKKTGKDLIDQRKPNTIT